MSEPVDRAPGDHLPPERIYVLRVSGQVGPGRFDSCELACMTHDLGAADRAAALWAKTVLRIARPRVKSRGYGYVARLEDLAKDVVLLRPLPHPERQVVTRRRKKGVQAKDVDAVDLLRAIESYCVEHGMWGNPWEAGKALGFPWKVVAAKANRLISRGLMTGSDAIPGNRAEYELTSTGRRLARTGPMWRVNPSERT